MLLGAVAERLLLLFLDFLGQGHGQFLYLTAIQRIQQLRGGPDRRRHGFFVQTQQMCSEPGDFVNPHRAGILSCPIQVLQKDYVFRERNFVMPRHIIVNFTAYRFFLAGIEGGVIVYFVYQIQIGIAVHQADSVAAAVEQCEGENDEQRLFHGHRLFQ